MMNRIVLGAALASVFALPATGADIAAATKATSAEHARLACRWVGRDRTLRPLRYTASPVHRTTAPEPHVVVSRAPAPAPAAEPTRRPIARMAVVLGVGF